MKFRFLSLFLLFMLLISFSVYAISFNPEETYNSVVVVYTETGVGSGFSVKENLIITNAHVVGNSKNIKVNLYDGTSIKGTVIKADNEKDLALIEIEKNLTPLTVSEKALTVGQEVYAVGAPKDMPYTMTKGIISALDRKLGQNTYIQIDASVNSGNSGGPLIDDTGCVLGIITLKASNAEGIGFALKASEILAFTEGVNPIPEESTNDADLSEENGEEKQKELLKITKENEFLKIAVITLLLLLMISVLLNLKSLIRKKEKDEFDFEIEIEE